ncbi:MAG TPA: glycosyltransferase family 2 protein [Bryobacteraceae bacterium]|nr:glycosyltransferase family 2 protein [Bryobacteraceae bacterium]
MECGIHPVALEPISERPLVSILVSCRNYERFVGECLISVLRQSYTEIEVLVCDDGSEDRSCDVITSIAPHNSRVRLIRQTNQGMAASLNAAWRASRGSVICLLDADDTFHPEKVNEVLAAFRNHPCAGFATHLATRTDACGHARGILPLLGSVPSGWCVKIILENGGILPNVPPTSNLSLRREVADALFPLPEEFRGFAERVIQRLAPFMTEVCHIDRPLATWRLHDTNDANAAYINLERMARDLQVMQRLWQMQRDYLDGKAPSLARRLAPITRSDYYSRLHYVWARLGGFPDAEAIRHELLSSPGFRQRPLPERLFWRLSPRLADSTFERISNMIMTQGRTKAFVGRLVHGQVQG